MGIEIIGFSWAERVVGRHSDRMCDEDKHYYVGIEEKLLDGLKPGCYTAGISSSFWVSYSGFSTWQQSLASVVFSLPASEIVEDEERFKGQPFVELIAFPYSNDVGIGPVTSAKLYRDFQRHAKEVKSGFERLAAEAGSRKKKGAKRPMKKKSRTATLAESLARTLGGTAIGGDNDPGAIDWKWKWKLYSDFRRAFNVARDDGLVIVSI
jgi:hypothetical protein